MDDRLFVVLLVPALLGVLFVLDTLSGVQVTGAAVADAQACERVSPGKYQCGGAGEKLTFDECQNVCDTPASSDTPSSSAQPSGDSAPPVSGSSGRTCQKASPGKYQCGGAGEKLTFDECQNVCGTVSPRPAERPATPVEGPAGSGEPAAGSDLQVFITRIVDLNGNDPSSIGRGLSYDVTVHVVNHGKKSTTETRRDAQASAFGSFQTVLSDAGTHAVIGAATTPQLAAGGRVVHTFRWTVPDTASGSVQLRVVADNRDAIAEDDVAASDRENNNRATLTIPVDGALPNLLVPELYAVRQGGTAWFVRGVLQNDGNVPVTESRFVTMDARIRRGSTVFCERTLDRKAFELQPGSSASFVINGLRRKSDGSACTLEDGDYTVEVDIDTEKNFAESNEGDNKKSVPFNTKAGIGEQCASGVPAGVRLPGTALYCDDERNQKALLGAGIPCSGHYACQSGWCAGTPGVCIAEKDVTAALCSAGVLPATDASCKS